MSRLKSLHSFGLGLGRPLISMITRWTSCFVGAPPMSAPFGEWLVTACRAPHARVLDSIEDVDAGKDVRQGVEIPDHVLVLGDVVGLVDGDGLVEREAHVSQ